MLVQNKYELSPLKLWSPLQRQLAACGQIKGSPQQWIRTIRNLQKKGVSAAEIKWSEVTQMLGENSEAEVPRKDAWRVLNLRTRETVGDEFVDYDNAEVLRRSMEYPVLENVGSFFLT